MESLVASTRVIPPAHSTGNVARRCDLIRASVSTGPTTTTTRSPQMARSGSPPAESANVASLTLPGTTRTRPGDTDRHVRMGLAGKACVEAGHQSCWLRVRAPDGDSPARAAQIARHAAPHWRCRCTCGSELVGSGRCIASGGPNALIRICALNLLACQLSERERNELQIARGRLVMSTTSRRARSSAE